jgi:hypothetical protein
MADTYWEHRSQEYESHPEKTVEGDYLMGECPHCGKTNTLVCMIDGQVHMRQAMKCTFCLEALPFGKEVQTAIDAGPDKTAKKVKQKAVEAVPEPEDEPAVELDPVRVLDVQPLDPDDIDATLGG